MHFIDSQGIAIDLHLTEARGPLRRMVGLTGATAMEAGTGLYLRGRHVHTFGMRFAIDAVHLDRAGRILRVVTLPPNRLGPLVAGARSVVEMKQGENERLGLQRRGARLVRGDI